MDEIDNRDKGKRQRKRKISFPLNLLRRLAEGRKYSSGSIKSQKSQTGSVKSVVRHDDTSDNTPEYVPLKRASNPGIIKRKSSNSDRKRKISYPLNDCQDGGQIKPEVDLMTQPVFKPEPVVKHSRYYFTQRIHLTLQCSFFMQKVNSIVALLQLHIYLHNLEAITNTVKQECVVYIYIYI